MSISQYLFILIFFSGLLPLSAQDWYLQGGVGVGFTPTSQSQILYTGDYASRLAIFRGGEVNTALQYLLKEKHLFELDLRVGMDEIRSDVFEILRVENTTLADGDQNPIAFTRGTVMLGYGYVFKLGWHHQLQLKMNAGVLFRFNPLESRYTFTHIADEDFPIDTNSSIELSNHSLFPVISPSFTYAYTLNAKGDQLGLQVAYFQTLTPVAEGASQTSFFGGGFAVEGPFNYSSYSINIVFSKHIFDRSRKEDF